MQTRLRSRSDHAHLRPTADRRSASLPALLIGLVALLGPAPAGRVLEEEGHRHIEDAGDMLEPAGTDAVGAFFVLLDLLECDPETLAQLFLAHAKHHAAQPDAAADVNINGIRRLLPGHCTNTPWWILTEASHPHLRCLDEPLRADGGGH